MADIAFIAATLIVFGVAHFYLEACDRLKVKPKP